MQPVSLIIYCLNESKNSMLQLSVEPALEKGLQVHSCMFGYACLFSGFYKYGFRLTDHCLRKSAVTVCHSLSPQMKSFTSRGQPAFKGLGLARGGDVNNK